MFKDFTVNCRHKFYALSFAIGNLLTISDRILADSNFIDRTDSTFRIFVDNGETRNKAEIDFSSFLVNTFGEWTNQLTNLVVVFVVFCIVSKFLVCDIFQYRAIAIWSSLLLSRLP